MTVPPTGGSYGSTAVRAHPEIAAEELLAQIHQEDHAKRKDCAGHQGEREPAQGIWARRGQAQHVLGEILVAVVRVRPM